MEKYLKLIENDYREEFERLFSLLTEANKRFNLTAVTDREGVFYKHFLDSLTGERYIKQNADVVEIGSGGGFPSLPLKIVRRDLKFTLIESTGKKCSYLNDCVKKLSLGGVRVINARAEEGARDKGLREKFDCAVARAVARMNTLCEYCLPYVKVGGCFVAYKGSGEEEIKESANALKVLGGEIEKIDKFTLPNGDLRTLVIVRKIKSTPPAYPRGQGKERKCPL